MELILPNKGFSSRVSLDNMLRKHNIRPSVQIEVNDVHSLLSLVEKGNWATLLNEKALIGWDKLTGIPIEGRSLLRRSYMLWQKGAYRKKAASLFAKELMKTLATG